MRRATVAAIASIAAAAFVFCVLQGLPAPPDGDARRPALRARNGGERSATPQTTKAFESTCRLSNWVTLGKCRKGTTEPGCYEAYTSYLDAGCLCDYGSYPWVFLPKDITPLGFTWALMETSPPHQLDDIVARAPCLETASDCRTPRDGDIKLATYTRGWLSVYHSGSWRRVVGRLSNATARAQCERLAFADGWVDESTAAVAAAPADAVGAVTLDEACLLAHRPFAECIRPAPRVDATGGPARARVHCLHSTDGLAHGPIGCFVDRYGAPTCLRGSGAATEKYVAGARIDEMPSLGCGTAGSRFLERAPLSAPSARDEPADPADASGAGCRVLFADAIQRCTAADDARRRMCSSSCHDAFIRAIRREDCFEERVGADADDGSYVEALKRSAEVIYTQCGQDLWQSAALAADTYDGCVELLLDVFHRCQSDSEKHLCSAACIEKLDEATGAESCYSVRYYRGESRAFRGHVALLNELRQRVCVWMPDEWDEPDDGEPVRAGGYGGSYAWRRRRLRR